MKADTRKWWILLCAFLMCAVVLMTFANRIQTDGGRVKISTGTIETEDGVMTYKLYTPENATEATPASAVLMLHGYQNDRETSASFAIELARRGVVVMSLDEYGHGYTTVGLLKRGYVNHKVTVNYGLDSEADGTFVSIGGQTRYRIMMNFSNLSFFNEHYTTDSDGNVLTDSSCGGIAAYAVLADMPNVDETRMAVSGHSMGTWASWSVAAAYAEAVNDEGKSIAPRAVVLQCGEVFTDDVYDSEKIHFNNVLILQAKYEEFSYFRDYKLNVTEELLKSDLRCAFLGTTPDKAAWDTTYGSFADGSARRYELLYTNHRLVPMSDRGLTVSMEWFDNSIGLDAAQVSYDNHTAGTKEFLTLAAMLLTLFALVPALELLLKTKFFGKVVVGKPAMETAQTNKGWWKGLIITVLISGLSFPFMTQLGHGLLPLPEGIFRMTVGNGFLSWYLFLIIVMIVTTLITKNGAKKKKKVYDWNTIGLSSPKNGKKLEWGLLFRSLLLVVILVAIVYLMTTLTKVLFDLDLRIIWPFFKSFNLLRLGQFFVYLPIFLLFYILNNSKIMAGMRTKATYVVGWKGFLSSWWRNLLAMAGGLILITLLEYVPFFMGIGPGADVLFGSTFGGPFMSLLILFVPQVFFFSLWCTYAYRRTGNVYTGAMTVAILACWIVTGGSSFI